MIIVSGSNRLSPLRIVKIQIRWPNTINLLEYGLPRSTLMYQYDLILRWMGKSQINQVRRTNFLEFILPQARLKSSCSYIVQVLIIGQCYTMSVFIFSFLSSYSVGLPSFILSAKLHLSPPLVHSLAFLQMLVPSRFCWKWQNMLRAVKALLRGHSFINASS